MTYPSIVAFFVIAKLIEVIHGSQNVPFQRHRPSIPSNVFAPKRYSDLVIGVLKEVSANERRVGLTPDSVRLLVTEGWRVVIERGAGADASFSDRDYVAKGADIKNRRDVLRLSDVVIKVQPPSSSEIDNLSPNVTLVSFLFPNEKDDKLERLENKNISALAMERVPKWLTRCQSFDALSSQASVAGKRAFLEALDEWKQQPRRLGRPRWLFGRPPQEPKSGERLNVLILGAGAAGLAAAQAAREASSTINLSILDERPIVQGAAEALTAQFFADASVLPELARVADIIICTAVFSSHENRSVRSSRTAMGQPLCAPILISEAVLSGMQSSAVVMDMAASDEGGNCAFSKPDRVVRAPSGVRIVGYTDLPSRDATVASELYGANVAKLLLSLGPTTDSALNGFFYLDPVDPVVNEMLVVDEGARRWFTGGSAVASINSANAEDAEGQSNTGSLTISEVETIISRLESLPTSEKVEGMTSLAPLPLVNSTVEELAPEATVEISDLYALTRHVEENAANKYFAYRQRDLNPQESLFAAAAFFVFLYGAVAQVYDYYRH